MQKSSKISRKRLKAGDTKKAFDGNSPMSTVFWIPGIMRNQKIYIFKNKFGSQKRPERKYMFFYREINGENSVISDFDRFNFSRGQK